jgi:hypothetical protein
LRQQLFPLEWREVIGLMSIFVWWAVAFLTLLTLAKIVDGLRAITLAISEARLDQQTIRLARPPRRAAARWRRDPTAVALKPVLTCML